MSVVVKVNCTYNNQGAWCKCKDIKRSWFGIGARVCSLYYNDIKQCDHQIKRYILPDKIPPGCPHPLGPPNEISDQPPKMAWKIIPDHVIDRDTPLDYVVESK